MVGEDAFAVQTPIKSLFQEGMAASKYQGFAELIVSEITEYIDTWQRQLESSGDSQLFIPLFDGIRLFGPFFLTYWMYCLYADCNELVLFTTSRCLVCPVFTSVLLFY